MRALALVLLLVASNVFAGELESREAVAHATTPIAHARALYELGLVQEAAGDRDGAIASYAQSLRVHGNAIVRARLARLDRELADSLDPYAPEKLLGPFESLDQFAAAEDQQIACHTVDAYAIARELAPARRRAPFRGAVVFAVGCNAFALFAGVQLDDGWYVTELVLPAAADERNCGATPTARAISVVPVRGATPRLRIDYDVETSCSARHSDETWGTTEADHVVIGVGASGVPAITAPITSSVRDWQDEATEAGPLPRKLGARVVFPITWHSDGSFTIAGPKHGTVDQNLVGHHVLRFP